MTATAQSLADKFAQVLTKEGALFTPQVAEGVVDFELDYMTFRLVIIEDTSDLEAIVVYRTRDVTDEEAAEFLAEQEEADEVDPTDGVSDDLV